MANFIQVRQEQLNNFLGPVEGALGGLPVAERNSEYYIQFKDVAGTVPELLGATSFGIEALIDANNNILQPSENSTAFLNLIQNFELGRNATVVFDVASSQNQSLGGTHQIIGIGSIDPILYNQTGSSVSASVNEIEFQEGNDEGYLSTNVRDFRGKIIKNSETITNTFATITGFDTEPLNIQGGGGFNLINGTYGIDEQSVDFSPELQTISFVITADIYNSETISRNGYLRLLRNGIEVETPTQVTLDPEETTSIRLDWTENVADFVYSDNTEYYTMQMQVDGVNKTASNIQFGILTQNPFPGSVNSPSSQLPFWQRGSSSNNLWITASGYLSQNYTKTQKRLEKSRDFGFSPIETPFNILPGDKIRFGYNPTNEYTIYEVLDPTKEIDGLLKFKLNTYLPSQIYLDNFVLFRINKNNPETIILNVPNNNIQNNIDFTGVIYPEYVSDRVKEIISQGRTILTDESRR